VSDLVPASIEVPAPDSAGHHGRGSCLCHRCVTALDIACR